jgi:hypothetical protein
MTAMKTIAIKVSGSGREPIETEIQPGTTPAQLLADLNLEDYCLCRATLCAPSVWTTTSLQCWRMATCSTPSMPGVSCIKRSEGQTNQRKGVIREVSWRNHQGRDAVNT